MTKEKTDLLDEGRVTMETDAAPLVRQFINIEQVQRDTIINPNNILNELLGLSSIFARYGLILAKARIQRDGFKSRRNLLAALLEKNIRDKAIEDGDKLTNPQVAARIAGSGRMVEAELALNEAAAILAACTEARDAIKVKRDMLVQLNKNQQSGMRMTTPVIPKMPVPEGGAGDADLGHATSTRDPLVDAIATKELLPADTLFGTPIAAVTETAAAAAAAIAVAASEIGPPDVSDCI